MGALQIPWSQKASGLVIAWLLLFQMGLAQQDQSRVGVSGQLTNTTTYNGTQFRLLEESLVPSLRNRLSGRFKIRVGKLEMPLRISWNYPAGNFRPDIETPLPLQMLQRWGGRNNFTQLSLDRKHYELAVGTVLPRGRTMAFEGVVPVNGAMAGLKGRNFRLNVTAGYSFLPQAADSTLDLKARPRQSLLAVFLRTGRPDSTYSHISYVRAEDDPNAAQLAFSATPQRSQSLGLGCGVRVGSFFQQAELLATLTSSNAGREPIEYAEDSWINNLFVLDSNSAPDLSGRAAMGFKQGTFELSANADYRGPQAYRIHTPFQLYDRARVFIRYAQHVYYNPENKRSLRWEWMFGREKTNLDFPLLFGQNQGPKTETANRLNLRGSVQFFHSQKFSLQAFFTNFEQRSVDLAEELTARQTFEMAGINAQFKLKSNRFSAGLNQSESIQYNFITDTILPVTTTSLNLSHQISWRKGKQSLRSHAFLMRQNGFDQFNFGATYQLRMEKPRLTLAPGFRVQRMQFVASGRIQQFVAALNCQYRPPGKLNFRWSTQVRHRRGPDINSGLVLFSQFTTQFSFGK